MLDVEHPDAGGGGNRADSELEDHVFLPAHEVAAKGHHYCDTQICPPDRAAVFHFGFFGGKAIPDEEQEHGGDGEEDQWIANQTVAEFHPL